MEKWDKVKILAAMQSLAAIFTARSMGVPAYYLLPSAVKSLAVLHAKKGQVDDAPVH